MRKRIFKPMVAKIESRIEVPRARTHRKLPHTKSKSPGILKKGIPTRTARYIRLPVIKKIKPIMIKNRANRSDDTTIATLVVANFAVVPIQDEYMQLL